MKHKKVIRLKFNDIEFNGNSEASKYFNALKPKQKKFVWHFILTRNATKAYQRAYNSNLKRSTAAPAGSHLLRHPNIKAFLSHFLDKRVEAYHKVTDTYFDMLEASKPNWKPNSQGEWVRVGTEPDWRVRKEGAAGISKLYGLNEKKPNLDQTQLGGNISMEHINSFNAFLESRGEEPVSHVPSVEAADNSVMVSKFAKEFKAFCKDSSM